MKKLITIFLTINILFVCNFVYADDENLEEEIDDNAWVYEELEKTNTNKKDEPTINSRSAVILDRTTGEIVWGKDENNKRKMASTTKIMTAIVVIENVKDLNEIVTVSKKAANVGGSRLGLSAGNKITVLDLLYGLMLKSGNDCAIALAEHVGGNVESFVDKMNEKVKVLNLVKTHFVTVNGLDADEHYTTAVELAKITDYALKNEKFAEIVRTKNYTVTINKQGKTISNTNELLGNLNGVYGVKTGFTNGANRCLVTAVKRGNIDIICIVLGADTKKDRTRDSIKLIEYVFSNYTIINIENKINEAFEDWNNKNNIAVIKGRYEFANIRLSEYLQKNIVIKNEDVNKINVTIESLKILEAPIEEATKVGELRLKIDNKTKIIVDLITDEKINKKSTKDYFKQIIKYYGDSRYFIESKKFF